MIGVEFYKQPTATYPYVVLVLLGKDDSISFPLTLSSRFVFVLIDGGVEITSTFGNINRTEVFDGGSAFILLFTSSTLGEVVSASTLTALEASPTVGSIRSVIIRTGTSLSLTTTAIDLLAQAAIARTPSIKEKEPAP